MFLNWNGLVLQNEDADIEKMAEFQLDEAIKEVFNMITIVMSSK